MIKLTAIKDRILRKTSEPVVEDNGASEIESIVSILDSAAAKNGLTLVERHF
jgi:hypothetical protein